MLRDKADKKINKDIWPNLNKKKALEQSLLIDTARRRTFYWEAEIENKMSAACKNK